MAVWRFRLKNLGCSSYGVARMNHRRYAISVCVFLAFCCLLFHCYIYYLVHYDAPDIKLSPIPEAHIEPNLGGHEYFLLALVTSTSWRTESLDLRETVRITWKASTKNAHLPRCAVVFNMGRAYSNLEDENISDERIATEANEYNDILVGNYEDKYTNLIIKVLFSFHWASKLKTKFVLKVDEDVYVRLPSLVQWMQTQEQPDRLYAGVTAQYLGVSRKPWETYFVSYKSYNASSYPEYCLGLFYVLSSTLIPDMLRAVRFHQAIPIEDIYIGLLMNHLHVPPRHLQTCTGKVGSLMPKLRCGDCFYYNSICLGHSLDVRRMLYVHARFLAIDSVDQTDILRQQCSLEKMVDDPWRSGKCKP